MTFREKFGNVSLITHTDMDGVGSAVLAYFFFEDSDDIYYANYNEIEAVLEKVLQQNYDTIIMADISVKKEVYSDLKNAYPNTRIIVLDHHATALELNEFKDCHVQVYRLDGKKTCGTELFYNWVRENTDVPEEELYGLNTTQLNSLKEFVEYVRKYDTWEWVETECFYAEKMNQIFFSLETEEWIKQIGSAIMKSTNEFLTEGQLMALEMKDKERERTLKTMEKQMVTMRILDKYVVGCVTCTKDISWIGNKLSEKHPGLDFVLLFSQGKVSGRTVKTDIDLGEIFRDNFGGGGHAQSAGFEFDPLEFFTTFFQELL